MSLAPLIRSYLRSRGSDLDDITAQQNVALAQEAAYQAQLEENIARIRLGENPRRVRIPRWLTELPGFGTRRAVQSAVARYNEQAEEVRRVMEDTPLQRVATKPPTVPFPRGNLIRHLDLDADADKPQ